MSALPRSGALGLRFAPRDDGGPGVRVTALVPQGAAAIAGVLVGDCVLALDGVALRDREHFHRLANAFRADVTVVLTVERDGVARDLHAVLLARPTEQTAGLRTRYESVAVRDGARLRTLKTRPDSLAGPLPAVLLLSGYARESVDFYAIAEHPQRLFAESIARAGYEVVRFERRGVGDSEGAKEDPGFEQESRDAQDVLRALLSDADVRSDALTLYGYSLGGLQAPSLAADDDRVESVVVFGSGVLTWIEYADALLRRRLAFDDASPATIERLVRAQQRLHTAVMILGKSLEETLASDDEIRAHSTELGVTHGTIGGRSDRFWREVYECRCADPLLRMTQPLMALWGEADWLSSKEEHALIAQIANGARPGSATFVPVENTDHGYLAHADGLASYRARWTGAYNDRAAQMVAAWGRRLLFFVHRLREHRGDLALWIFHPRAH